MSQPLLPRLFTFIDARSGSATLEACTPLTITVPAGINFTKTKATSKGILEATSFARHLE